MKVIMQCYLITPCSLVKVCLSTNIYVATRSWQTPHMWPSLSCTRWFRCSLIDRRVLKHWLHAVIHHQTRATCNQWIARTEHWWESRGRSLNLPEALAAEWLSSLSRVYMWTLALISPAPQQICALGGVFQEHRLPLLPDRTPVTMADTY